MAAPQRRRPARRRGRANSDAERRALAKAGGRRRGPPPRAPRPGFAVLSTDGGSRGNPGPAAIGYMLVAADGALLAAHGESIGVAGANVAEYRALLAGLEHAHRLGLDRVDARCDARLVVDHVSGDREPANPRLRALCASIREAAERIGTVVFTWVPAEANGRAHALVAEALAASVTLPLAMITRTDAHEAIQAEDLHGARNYAPLPVVLTHGEGVWVHDVEGRRYFDALSAYSALNFGHRHPRLVRAAMEQLKRLTLTSRAFHSDQLGPFCAELAAFCERDRVLPMNTGAEAVETAIKLARKWGYERKGVEPDRAEIVVCAGNFHGRTTTIVGFSDDPLARTGFGPFAPGFVQVPYGDADALRSAVGRNTVAFLVEPVQGEAGVIIPPAGYLAAAREICDEAGVLLIADEVQSGLGRAGRRFACDHEDVRPDLYVLGKALGGGIVPVSAVAGTDEVLGVLRPGEHGSTFGGNPFACAVAREVLRLLADASLVEESAALGDAAAARLRAAAHPAVREVRQRGLWLGIELVDDATPARRASELLMERGVLAKDTHETTLRIAPPLTVTAAELDWALERLDAVLAGLL